MTISLKKLVSNILFFYDFITVVNLVVLFFLYSGDVIIYSQAMLAYWQNLFDWITLTFSMILCFSELHVFKNGKIIL